MSTRSSDPTVLINEAMKLVRLGEALANASSDVSHVCDSLGRVGDHDPDLAPEIVVALQHLKLCGDAIQRALTFSTTRYEVIWEQAVGLLPPIEEAGNAEA